jgi:hypothetical protein
MYGVMLGGREVLLGYKCKAIMMHIHRSRMFKKRLVKHTNDKSQFFILSKAYSNTKYDNQCSL